MLKKKKQAEGFVQKPQPESDVSIVSSFAKLTHLPCMVGFAFNLEPPRQKSRLKLQTLHLDDSKIHVEFEKKQPFQHGCLECHASILFLFKIKRYQPTKPRQHKQTRYLGGGFKKCFIFVCSPRKLGKIPMLD